MMAENTLPFPAPLSARRSSYGEVLLSARQAAQQALSKREQALMPKDQPLASHSARERLPISGRERAAHRAHPTLLYRPKRAPICIEPLDVSRTPRPPATSPPAFRPPCSARKATGITGSSRMPLADIRGQREGPLKVSHLYTDVAPPPESLAVPLQTAESDLEPLAEPGHLCTNVAPLPVRPTAHLQTAETHVELLAESEHACLSAHPAANLPIVERMPLPETTCSSTSPQGADHGSQISQLVLDAESVLAKRRELFAAAAEARLQVRH